MRRRLFRWTEGANPKLVPNDARSTRVDLERPKRPRGSVVGLDLSLRAAAACALPFPWDHDLSKVRMLKTGLSLPKDATHRQRLERYDQIAHDVSVFCVNTKAFRIGVEEYAYSAGGANATQLSELGGAVKLDLLRILDVATYPVQASSARKILLQYVPRLGAGKTKPWVVQNVKRLKGPSLEWTDDECDAFVVANAVLEHAGGTALSYPGH